MIRKKVFRYPICVVLVLTMLFDFVIATPTPAGALEKKSLAIGLGIGAAAGAGAVLAAPAIGGAIASAGGLAGIGTAVVGGLAAVGGAIVGVVSAIGGAVAAAASAVVGWIAGLIASPLFIPALIVIGVCVAGYLIYRHYKKTNKGECKVLPDGKTPVVMPGDYDMNPVIPPMNQPGGITIGDEDGIVIPGSEVVISSKPPVNINSDIESNPAVISEKPQTISMDEFAKIEKRYREAFARYTKLVTSGAQGDIKAALEEYRAAHAAYEKAKKAANIK